MSNSQPPPFVEAGDILHDFLRSFWQRQVSVAERETPDYRHPALPLARIKKVMKGDPDVKMIAADAPILFCKACEIFIAEVTARAFIVADSNKRRTLSRQDIAKAVAKSDQFDFLIDIVPREDPYGNSTAAKRKKDQRQDQVEYHSQAADGHDSNEQSAGEPLQVQLENAPATQLEAEAEPPQPQEVIDPLQTFLNPPVAR